MAVDPGMVERSHWESGPWLGDTLTLLSEGFPDAVRKPACMHALVRYALTHNCILAARKVSMQGPPFV